MAQRYALLEGDEVVNIILWDEESEFEVPEGQVAKLATEEVGPGWKFTTDWVPQAALPDLVVPEPAESQEVVDAKLEALRQLIALGITEPVARTIVGLPPA